MEFEPILALLIQTVQLALVDDEDNGRQALDSLCELTGAHPEVWKNNTDKLLDTITKILQVKTYEPGTRSAAIEVVLSLSEEMPAALRKSAVTNQFFVELSQMLTEVELDEIEWTSSIESKDNLGTDVYSTAVSAITRFSKDIGEKKTLEANKSEIMKKIQSANWVDREAGYTCLGLIAESCADYFKKELEQSFNLAKMGVSDSHYRVKYAALGAMANLFAVCAPTAQSRYHTEVLPVLIQLMLTEPLIKMQT